VLGQKDAKQPIIIITTQYIIITTHISKEQPIYQKSENNKKMRPPIIPHANNAPAQIRPRFETVAGPSPIKTRGEAAENKNSLMTQACIRPPQSAAIPLIDTDDRGVVRGDYSRNTITPKLAPRPSQNHAKPLVSTWN
jgi:hypothetical protein